MKILYYNCFSGISGDMNLAAMIDLGVDKDYILRELSKLGIHGYGIKVKKDQKNGITGTRVDVILDEPVCEQHNHRNHHHRTMKDVEKIINSSSLNHNVKKISLDIFYEVARAEAKVHGKSMDEVQFHEVGAVDSIVDIVGAAICFDYLKVDKIMCSTIELGGGFAKCAHGIIPIPAPATSEILKDVKVSLGRVNIETTTPTGAAILKSQVSEYTDKVSFKVNKVSYGIGHADIDIPNVLRVMIGEVSDENTQSEMENVEETVLESNIDDMNPEIYEYVMDKLFEAGAKDVYITPIIMKKGRPGNKLSVLCSKGNIQKIKYIIFKETTSLGCRSYTVTKTMLKREFRKINTTLGQVAVKSAYLNGKIIKSKPEYDDCKGLAKKNNVSIKEVYDAVKETLKGDR
ncbi:MULTISPECIES: nickel pincer cofactor biosynthesis protein LarC [Clostridium]|uniref:nickel pincer cofactor biosynthesis protein LarC n=1 Tax=Clostridium TaxID=1485 RepID=UPI0008257704|nr:MULTISPECIES: nickel pincer cofactor biosynthesis protein LarC [Clostridium]PJI08832.1 DUF111 domain-containing protein [Clostridium sp. CT7]